MKSIVAVLFLQVLVQSELPPPLPQIDIINGRAGVVHLSATACAGPLTFAGKTWRCRPDYSLVIAVPPETTLFGPTAVTDSEHQPVAIIDVGATVFHEDHFPASSGAKPGPLERLAQDKQHKDAAYAAHEDRRWSAYHVRAPLQNPLTVPYRIATAYGSQRYYGTEGPNGHYAADLGSPSTAGTKPIAGKPVTTIAPGVIVLAERLWLEGGTVIIYHGDSVYSAYCHLATLTVRAGDQVASGTTVGTVGNTGAHTSGPHLHLVVRIGGIPVDPLDAIATLNRSLTQ